MGTVNLEKLFKKVYEEDHHNLDLLIKIYIERDLPYWDEEAKTIFQKVIYDRSWSAEEKARLIDELHIGFVERRLKINNNEKDIPNFAHTLMFKNETGLKALVIHGFKLVDEKNLSSWLASILYYINQRTFSTYQKEIKDNHVDTYGPSGEHEYFGYIYPGQFTHKDELSYMKLVLSVIPEEMIPKLVNENINIINFIINTQNFKFIDKYLDLYNGDISVFLPAAVETGNLYLVKHLVSKGANPNYQYKSQVNTPVEVAVLCNYNHILKYLIECGASVDIKRNHRDQLYSATEMSYLLTKYHQHVGLGYYCSYDFMRPHQGVKLWGNSENEYTRTPGSEVPKKSIKRTEIVHTCFENSNLKNELDYTSILITSIFSVDKKYINEYVKYIRENNIDIDLFKILDFIKISNCDNNDEIIQYLKDYIIPCCTNASEKITKYLNNIVTEWPIVKSEQEAGHAIKYSITYIDTLLNFVSDEDKKNVILVPHVRNVRNLKVLLKHGFDVNQKDEHGNTILINLFTIRDVSYDYGDFSEDEFELFKFLTKKDQETNETLSDITICNESGYNALAMGIKFLHLHDEDGKSEINNVNIKTKVETALVELTSMLPKECVDIDSVHKMLERRLIYRDIGPDGKRDGITFQHGKLLPVCVYQNHFYLFTELKKKMNFSKKFSHNFFDEYFSLIEGVFGTLTNIDYEKTEEFLYSCIDDDNEIQHLSISNVFDELSKKLPNASYEEYLKMLQELSETSRLLEEFYHKHISNKICKDKYLEFVAKKYGTRYDVSQHYLIQFISYGISNFGIDKVEEILHACPQFDNNSIESFKIPLNFASIYSANFEYFDAAGYPHEIDGMTWPKIAKKRFWDLCDDETYMKGTLMSYAILLDDLELVKKLERLGFDFYPECDEEVDIIWDYVTSSKMKEYLESKVGSQFFAGLNGNEIEYITGKNPRSRKGEE